MVASASNFAYTAECHPLGGTDNAEWRWARNGCEGLPVVTTKYMEFPNDSAIASLTEFFRCLFAHPGNSVIDRYR